MAPPRAFGYIRDSGLTGGDGSPTAAITDYAKQRDLLLTTVIHDDADCIGLPLSERPGGRQLLRRLRPGDHVVLARLEDVFEKGVRLLDTLRDWAASRNVVHVAAEDGGFELAGDVVDETLRLCESILEAFPPSFASSPRT